MRQSAYNNNIRRTILIVEDEYINQQILGNIAKDQYDVLYANNGLEALETIRSLKTRLSLILLDLIMPGMNGYELLEILGKSDTLSRIPVIVLTGEKSAELKSFQLGAVDFITKPFDMPDIIMARIRRSIALSEDTYIIQTTQLDEVTQLYTREYFFTYARQQTDLDPDRVRDALVLNISHFHLVNEMYGRDFGDTVLRAAAGAISEYLRQAGGIAGRPEGDTFYVFADHRDSHAPLLEAIESAFSGLGSGARLRIRMGVCPGDGAAVELEHRFDRAARACHSLRNNYLENVAFFSNEMHERELYSERLIADVDDAIGQRHLQVWYQPKYAVQGSEPVLGSAEALIRWEHPQLGTIRPGTFIPLFEENGLIRRLDRYVWTMAAEQIRFWKDSLGVSVPVSVNVSRVDLFDPLLEETLLGILREYGLTPEDLLLEITESAYTDNSGQVLRAVEMLRRDGFKIEMDDFGSGYSSLNMLRSIPVDAIKLDMKFICNITTSGVDRQLVHLIMEIAKFMGVPVVAEGVENREQMEFLKDAGVDIIQGYYFSKPLTPQVFSELIKEARTAHRIGGQNADN